MTYDAFGRWVERYNASQNRYTQAVYGPDGSEVAVMNGGTLVSFYVNLPKGAKAVYGPSGLNNYWHPDWLGTPRLMSSPTRTILANLAFGAYGEQYQGVAVDSMYTGVAQAPEATDLRKFPVRELSTIEGRWLTPDPAGMDAVDITNPQSLNRYAYVLGNPLGLVDPTGLEDDVPDWATSVYATPDPISWWNWSWANNIYNSFWSRLTTRSGAGNNTAAGGSGGGSKGKTSAPASGTPPKSGTNAARSCTVPAPPGGSWPAVQRTAWAASLLVDFLTGTGPANFNFAPDSVPSQGMASTDTVQAALNDYYMTGRTSGLYTFNAPEVIRTGANSMGQFVGSSNWTITQANGGINLSLSNSTSVWSGAYHHLPSHSRSSFAPLGTTHQTYNIYARCGG